MARGLLDGTRSLDAIFQVLFDRIKRLERPSSIHIGSTGSGFTISVDKATGNLIVTSDAGTVTEIAKFTV